MLSDKNFFPALTGIRAVAAYMVFIHHFNPFYPSVFGKDVFEFGQQLHIGVTIFFVLSGFLITHRYHDKEIGLKRYFINRFARIYPIYFLLTSITFIIFFISQPGFDSLYLIKTYFLNITFLNGFFNDLKFTGIAQGWTLTVEESFYVLAPLIFLLIRRSYLYIFILPVSFVLIGIFLVKSFSSIEYFGFFESFDFMLTYTFFGRCFEFFFGIALAILLRKNINKGRSGIYTAVGLLFILISVLLLSKFPMGINSDSQSVYGILINSIFLPLFGICPLFYGLVTEKTFVSKILGSRVFMVLGKSSYVFYLIHLGFISTFLNDINSNVLFTFLSLNIISVVIYKYVEEPINSFIRKFYNNFNSLDTNSRK